MPRRRFIDKKNATTFALVHRAQNDPLIHDADASQMVFTEIRGPRQGPDDDDDDDDDDFFDNYDDGASTASRSGKVKQRGDLDDEFGMKVRANEGEAAEHGIFFDDSNYDYMQHMRELGGSGGEVTWVEAPSARNKNDRKGKGKLKLEDALKTLDLDGGRSEAGMSTASSRSLLPDDVLGSEFVRKTTYLDQQDVPDTIAGLQPNMDPRLREVLEALDDEAYVDDEDDIFAELAGDAEEVDEDEFEALAWQQEDGDNTYDEGWESDDTIKAGEQPTKRRSPRASLAGMEGGEVLPPSDTQAQPPADPTGGSWMHEFAKFKQDVKSAKGLEKREKHPDAPSESINTGLSSLASGRRKKRKGALTNPSAYSMSSSALHRTDAQSLLDARFDKIEEEYADEYADFDDSSSQFDDAASFASGMTGASRASRMSAASGVSRASGISTYSRATDSEAPELVRRDFDSIMDGFLEGHSRTGGRGQRIKKSGYQTGLEQLEEIRRQLGPARMKQKPAAR